MKKTHDAKKVVAALAILTVVGCVLRTEHHITTEHKIEAHVVVEIIQVESAIDNMEDYISGEVDTLEIPEPGSDDTARLGTTSASGIVRWIARVFDPFPTAYAQARAQSGDSSTKIRRIAEMRKARFGEIKKHKGQGCIGEDNRGYVAYRECPSCADDASLKTKVQKLVQDENKDRKEFYRELVRQSGSRRLSLRDVETTSARKMRERLQAGDWFQTPEAGKEFDAFKTTDVGKKLTSAQADKWYQAP